MFLNKIDYTFAINKQLLVDANIYKEVIQLYSRFTFSPRINLQLFKFFTDYPHYHSDMQDDLFAHFAAQDEFVHEWQTHASNVNVQLFKLIYHDDKSVFHTTIETLYNLSLHVDTMQIHNFCLYVGDKTCTWTEAQTLHLKAVNLFNRISIENEWLNDNCVISL